MTARLAAAPPPNLGLEAEIDLACPEWREAVPAIDALVRHAASAALAQGLPRRGIARRHGIELGVTLSDDAAQRRLNRDFRGRDAATNVLSFPAFDPSLRLPDDAPMLLGDIVLALETVRREAAEQGKPLDDHIRHLVVHGALHLIGYDHESDPDAVAMESLEREILAGIGVPDPYADPPAAEARASTANLPEGAMNGTIPRR